MAREREITFTLSLPKARALNIALTHGLAAVEAHGLVANTQLMKAAIADFRAALPAR